MPRGRYRWLPAAALLLLAVFALSARAAQTPAQVCLAKATPHLVDGRSVVAHATLSALSPSGQRAEVALSDGCNNASCTAERALWGWWARGDLFWTIAYCGDISYEFA